jgi:hypothetical protein
LLIAKFVESVMERSVIISVGVVLARSGRHDRWHAIGFTPGSIPLSAGSLIRTEGEVQYAFAGCSNLALYAGEIDSYLLAIEPDVPSMYVVLKPKDDGEQIPAVHLTTVAADEAESYLEGDECIIDEVPMPHAILELTARFVAAHSRSLPPHLTQWITP